MLRSPRSRKRLFGATATIVIVLILLFVSQSGKQWLADVPSSLVSECVEEMAGPVRDVLPVHNILRFSYSDAKVACYDSSDIVCSAILQHGEFEKMLLVHLKSAAETLRGEHRRAFDILSKRDAALAECISTEKGVGSVLYIDLGGNVGSFAMNMLTWGFDVMAFEAMPSNHALLTLGSCINLKSNADHVGQWQLTHVALGPSDAESECVILSGEANVGDGNIICDAATVQLHRDQVKKPSPNFRAFVRLGSLDTRLFASDGSPQGLLAYRAAKCFSDSSPEAAIDAGVPAKVISQRVREAPPEKVAESWDTGRLRTYVQNRPVVVKIDVEGFEYLVMRGAAKLLKSSFRPKLILSEVFLERPPIVDYVRDMMQTHGYAVFCVERGQWVRAVGDVQRIADTARPGYQENFIFVEPGYEFLIK